MPLVVQRLWKRGTNFHPGRDVDGVGFAVVDGLQSYRRRVDVDWNVDSAAVERTRDAVSVIRSLRFRRATSVTGHRRRITDPIHDHLQPIVAYADRDVAERNACQIKARGKLSINKSVESQTRREVVIRRVDWNQTADARQVVVVVVVQATRVRPHSTRGCRTAPQPTTSFTTRRSHVLAAHQFHLKHVVDWSEPHTTRKQHSES